MKPIFSIKKIYSVPIIASAISAGWYMSVNAEEEISNDDLVRQKAEFIKELTGRDPLAIDVMDELEKARERINEIGSEPQLES